MVVAKNFSEFYFIDKNRVDKWFNDSSGTHFETFECDDLILDSSDDELVINDLLSRLNEYSGLSNTSKYAKAMSVFEFWTLLNTLKDTIRTGWMRSNVSKERIESVAEHVYSTNNLAIAMASQFGYSVDLFRVVFMIAIHEIGEAVIGDIPVPEQGVDKATLERQAVIDIINGLISKDLILNLFDEFEAKETDEAKFAYQCDKVDCDLQCGAYQGYVNDEDWSNKWIEYDINKYKYDENFEAVARLAMKKKED